MPGNNNRMPNRTTTFRKIPLTRIIDRINGPEVREEVYDFGRRTRKQDIEVPGQVYPWARGLLETDNE